MIPLPQLKTIASEKKVPPATIIKDYLLTWLLAGLSESPLFKRMWFTGGTALKKVYYKDYRFSEDIDLFTPGPCASRQMTQRLTEILEWTYNELGIRFASEGPYRFNDRYQYRIVDDYFYAAGMIPDRQPLLIDIACFDPEFLEEPQEKVLIIEYQDIREAKNTVSMVVPSILDILIRKMFAVQDRKEPRDLYDLATILTRESLSFEQVLESYCQRFHPISKETFLREITSPMLEKSWEIRLSHQVPGLPSFDKVIEEISANIRRN